MSKLRIVAAFVMAGTVAAGCRAGSTAQGPENVQTVASTALSVGNTVPATVTVTSVTVPTGQPADTPAPSPATDGLSNDNTYVNSAGHTIHSPAYSTSGGVPAGATAQCNDGTFSFSVTHSGTCSHHGGVARWLTP